MATLVSEQLRWLADQWENHCGYKSAVLSGIVPDRAHLDTGGYHCSVEDLKAYGNGNDYSNTRPDDRGHNPKHGAGVDMSMSPADMKRCYLRVKRVWDDKSDTRRRYLNAINTWKGSGDATRLDFYANVTSWATPDHKWHNHLEVRRRWLRDWTAVPAIVSVLKGESHAAWLKSQKPAAAPTKPKEDDVTPEDIKKIAEETAKAVLGYDPAKKDDPYAVANIPGRHDSDSNHNVRPAYAMHDTWRAAREVERRISEVLAGQQAARLRDEAILARLDGADHDAVLARIDQRATELADALNSQVGGLRELVEAVGRGERDAADVVDEIGRRLTAVPATNTPG